MEEVIYQTKGKSIASAMKSEQLLQQYRLEGEGFSGTRGQAELGVGTLYFTEFNTHERVLMEKPWVAHWLQFHFQLQGYSKTLKANPVQELIGEPGQFSLHYAPHDGCTIQFNKHTHYRSMGFTFSREAFLNTHLGEFPAFSTICRSIENHTPFLLSEKWLKINFLMKERLHKILSSPYQGNLQRVFLEHQMTALIFEVAENLESRKRKEQRLSREAKQKAMAAEAYIRANIDQALTINEVTKEVGTNEYTLKKSFRQLYSTSMMDYWLGLRLEKARTELLDTDKKIIEVAYDTGYASAASFSKAFFKRFGVRPSELKR
jgi:AraC-like DNA-binding protein